MRECHASHKQSFVRLSHKGMAGTIHKFAQSLGMLSEGETSNMSAHVSCCCSWKRQGAESCVRRQTAPPRGSGVCNHMKPSPAGVVGGDTCRACGMHTSEATEATAQGSRHRFPPCPTCFQPSADRCHMKPAPAAMSGALPERGTFRCLGRCIGRIRQTCIHGIGDLVQTRSRHRPSCRIHMKPTFGGFSHTSAVAAIAVTALASVLVVVVTFPTSSPSRWDRSLGSTFAALAACGFL